MSERADYFGWLTKSMEREGGMADRAIASGDEATWAYWDARRGAFRDARDHLNWQRGEDFGDTSTMSDPW